MKAEIFTFSGKLRFCLCDSSVIVLDWKVLNGVLRFFVLFYIPIIQFFFITNNCLIRCYRNEGSLTVSTFCYSLGGYW